MISFRAISAVKELEREKDVCIGNITCIEIKLRAFAYKKKEEQQQQMSRAD